MAASTRALAAPATEIIQRTARSRAALRRQHEWARATDWIGALAVVEHDGGPLIISAGEDRAIVANRAALRPATPFSAS